MSSQFDLDQGGTVRQWVIVDMGPGVGRLWKPKQNLFSITSAGTYNIDRSTNLVEVNSAGSVTIVLPSVTQPAAGAGAVPGKFVQTPIVIADILGNASSVPITIQPSGPSQSIMGLTSIQIGTNFGAYTLQPVPATLTWVSISP